MKKRDFGTLAAGMVLGAALTGGAAAAGVIAEPSWQNIYVDGQQVHMTAYNIAGNNYVKLRDIGQEVGFNVYWANGVQVDSTAPYTGEPPAPVPAQKAITVSSYKGNTLKAGDRSGLIIGPSGPVYTVTSSNPAVVAVEQVSANWVAAAKSTGSAIITVSNDAGETGSLSLTVEETISAKEPPASSGEIDLNANMEIRQEMIRLINEVRRKNGVAELSVNESLMNAAQDCAAHQMRNHSPYEWQVLQDYGWSYGGGFNLTCFNATGYTYAAQTAIFNWSNSPGHFQTMIRENATCLGAGIYLSGGMAYCYMVVGDPSGHSPL
ncbi:MAG: CAP domain-containing protein [Oscillibacter sp.]|jgi:uncharacterized protein YkwD|nr:CAP domain-containing protein [Oscillibacter sp.]